MISITATRHAALIAAVLVISPVVNADDANYPPGSSTIQVNEIQIHGLEAFAGRHLTAFYLWAIPLAIDFGDNPASPIRNIHPPYTTAISEDGTATIPRSTIKFFGFPRLTHIRILIHKKPKIFLCRNLQETCCEPLPGDTRTAQGCIPDQTQTEIHIGWEIKVNDNPGLTYCSGEAFQLNPFQSLGSPISGTDES